MHPVDISVVIPAYNGYETIKDCIQSVITALEGRDSEIIVVESSGDESRLLIKESYSQIRLIESSERLTAGQARNTGAQAANGKKIFFVDQDCVVPNDWIDRLEFHLDKENVVAAGGSVSVRNLKNLSGFCVYFLEFLNHFPSKSKPTKNKNFLVGCNSAYHAEIFKRISFPNLTLSEDVLFSYQIKELGFDIIYDSDITVGHWNRTGWGEFFRYNKKMGKAAVGYHDNLQRPIFKILSRISILVYLTPFIILPKIFLLIAYSNKSYLLKFIILSPMCFLGNITWANSFRKELLASKKNN